MKLLLDQGLPLSAAPVLNHLGIDTVHTGEIGFETAEDALILARARAENRVRSVDRLFPVLSLHFITIDHA